MTQTSGCSSLLVGLSPAPLGQGRSAKPDAIATPSVQVVSKRELHAMLRSLTFMGASFVVRL